VGGGGEEGDLYTEGEFGGEGFLEGVGGFSAKEAR